MNDIQVKRIEEIEPYSGPQAIPGVQFRPARQALGVESWGMNILELDPNCAGHPAHDHAGDGHEEVYVILRGSAVLQTADAELPLSQGDLVRVGPKTRRQLVTKDEGATILALGGTPGKPYAMSMGG